MVAATAAILGSRMVIFIVGAVAVTIVGTQPPPVPEALWRVSPHEVANMFARWDTYFYYSIATRGYAWNPALFTYQNVVFFPLYPMLMRWLGALIGGHPMIAGLVISLAAFASALVVVYRLALLELGEDYAWRVILLIAVFPYALFFSAVYTESLFLLLTVAAFYAMRRGRLAAAAVCGLLAGLSRPNGFWLSVPLACLVLLPAGRSQSDTSSDAIDDESVPAGLIAACAPVVGAALFSAYLRVRFGDPLAWVHGQSAWGVPLLGRMPAPDPIQLPTEAGIGVVEWIVYAGNIGAFAAAAAAMRPVMRRVGFAYGIWIAVNLLPPLVEHLFMSMGRFVAVLFPVFFWMALRIPRDRLWPIAGAFAAAQALLAAGFFLWWGVF